MVDITSLKARLARLRLSSNIAEEAKHDRRLEDPVTAERRKKKKQKKAQSCSDMEKQQGRCGHDNLITEELEDYGKGVCRDCWKEIPEKQMFPEEKKLLPKNKAKKAAQDPYNEYTKNTNKRKKNNKLTRSDQKRGSLDAGYGDYTKNTGGKRKKKNKLTRSDQKRGKVAVKKKKKMSEYEAEQDRLEDERNTYDEKFETGSYHEDP